MAWAEEGNRDADRKGDTPLPLLGLAFYAHSAQILADTARVLGRAGTELETPCEKVASSWKKSGAKVVMDITAPPNNTTTIEFPDGRASRRVQTGTHRFESGIPAAAEWFVAPEGDDSAAGTLAKPCAAVQRAQQSASAGDTVYLRGGTYEVKNPGASPEALKALKTIKPTNTYSTNMQTTSKHVRPTNSKQASRYQTQSE